MTGWRLGAAVKNDLRIAGSAARGWPGAHKPWPMPSPWQLAHLHHLFPLAASAKHLPQDSGYRKCQLGARPDLTSPLNSEAKNKPTNLNRAE